MSNFKLPKVLFLSTLILGILITASSSSWFSAWMGLELNLLSFIPLLISQKNKYSSEAAMKYFLIQALSSSLILVSAPYTLFFGNLPFSIILVSLLLKLGAAPFHFWFPSVMQNINWPECIMLMTIQKLAPFSMISSLIFKHSSYVIVVSSLLSSLVGGIGGLNQVLTRKLIAFSSINHISWMLAALYMNEQIWLIYFLTYTLVSTSLIFIFQTNQIFHLNQISSLKLNSNSVKMSVFLSLFSLGGLPPFLGFLPKWLVIQEFLSTNSSLMWLMVLLFSVLLTLFFYLRMAIMSLLFSSSNVKPSLSLQTSSNLLVISVINLTPLLFPSCFLLFY